MSTPSIPGPYHSPEQTEAFPLKHSIYQGTGGSNKGKGFRILTSCCAWNSSDRSGLRIIVMCFTVLTLAVIIALAVQIYYGDYQVSVFKWLINMIIKASRKSPSSCFHSRCII